MNQYIIFIIKGKFTTDYTLFSPLYTSWYLKKKGILNLMNQSYLLILRHLFIAQAGKKERGSHKIQGQAIS